MKHLILAISIAACGSSPPPAPVAQPQPIEPFTPTAFGVKVEGKGRPVILIPGLGSPGSVWDGTVAHLAGKFQTHELTLAGFAGQPAIPPPFLISVHDQIVHYIKANRLDHPIIVGHSLGGMMSLWLAETNSADLGGIVDVDGLPFLTAIQDPKITEAQGVEIGKKMHDAFIAMPADGFAAATKQTMATMITKPEDQARILDATNKSDRETFANAFAEMAGKDLRPDLPKITTKVTIIAAGDGPAPRPQLEAAWHTQIDAIKAADLHIVDNAKHFVMLDQPDAFYGLLDAALTK